LIATKLLPLGLVLDAEGNVVAPSNELAARSPLSVNLKSAQIGPRFIDPVTAVLQHLFHRPVIIVVLLTALVAHGWILVAHGVAGGVHDLLYNPGLMLAMLGIIIVSTAFHEFGHASALRYGGGTVRGMGAGLYLVYPALFTDVTDNYRLGRWARVRTDLGGFYFNLVFSLGLVALYAVTGWEFLLLIVLLIDLEIVHQSLPFVRLDGYWALADLTGIPDLFSQMGPFLRSVLPVKRWQGRRLPNLKTWVKVVFGVYTLVTVPLLLLLLFLMVRGAPRVLATAWDSGRQQWQTLTDAWSGSNWIGVSTGALQLLLLLLPTLGLVYMFVNIGRQGGGALYRWSAPTPARRFAGSTMTVALVASLAFLWAPALPFGGSESGPLYASARERFRPISTSEHGALGDALPRSLPVFSNRGAPTGGAPTATTAPIEAPGAAGTPAETDGSPTATVAASGTASPTASTTPALTPTVTATASTPTVTSTDTPTPAAATEPTATSTETPIELTPAPAPTETPNPNNPTTTAAP
jgi:putative peptide zinc metalloprotease protein